MERLGDLPDTVSAAEDTTSEARTIGSRVSICPRRSPIAPLGSGRLRAKEGEDGVEAKAVRHAVQRLRRRELRVERGERRCEGEDGRVVG